MNTKNKKFLLNVCSLVLCLLLFPAVILAGENDANQIEYRQLRSLSAEELQEADKARDDADKMLAEYKRIYRISRSRYPKIRPNELANMPISKQQIRDFERSASAYKEIVDKYEGTEIAAYTQLRLCEPYRYMGQYQEAVSQAQKAAEIFVGTIYETKAYHRAGMIYLQDLREAQRAADWFEKITKPANNKTNGAVTTEKNDQNHWLYLSAQQQIAKCEIQLGKAKNAIKRYEELAERYPQNKATLDHDLEFELNADMRQRFKVQRIDFLADLMGSDISVPTLTDTPQPIPLPIVKTENRVV
jgi:tetratricopeptide (TPR) repeat protein